MNKDDFKKLPYSYKILEADKCKKKRYWKNTVIAVFRLIAAYGLSPAYPRVLGAKEPSVLRENLNALIGTCGYVNGKTLRWPDCTGHAFYNDISCGKECMATEYLAQLMMMLLESMCWQSGTCDQFGLMSAMRIVNLMSCYRSGRRRKTTSMLRPCGFLTKNKTCIYKTIT